MGVAGKVVNAVLHAVEAACVPGTSRVQETLA